MNFTYEYRTALVKPLLTILFLIIPGLLCHADDYHKSNGSKEGPQHSPLGILGASGIFQVKRDDIRVKVVDKGSCAAKGGLRVGDIIIAANGKKFDQATNDVNDGGKGPRVGLGYAIEEALASAKKQLSLLVLRKKQKEKLTLPLPKLQPLSKSYPYYCARSEETLEALCAKLLTLQKPNGCWGRWGVNTATAAMALLGSGDKKYRPAVKKAAYYYIGRDLKAVRLHSWEFIYVGTFLCEYYLASGDSRILKTIQYICDTLALEGTSDNGRHAHGMSKNPGYDGKGINIISSHVFLVWTLAAKCGIKIHKKPYDATLAWLTKCTAKNGGTGYNGPFANADGSARTGLFTLGLYLSKADKGLMKIQGEYLVRHTRRMREAHANSLFGMIWGSAALACVNEKGFRQHMDYWKWYIALGRTPKGHDNVRYFIGGKRSSGGDGPGYLEFDLYNHSAMGMLYAIGRKKLFVHGNTQRSWWNGKGSEDLITFYKKIYKDKGDLLEYLKTKIDELASPAQLAATLRFLKSQINGQHKKLARPIYDEIISRLQRDINNLRIISRLKPTMAYSQLLRLKKIVRYEPTQKAQIASLLKPLTKSRSIKELHRLSLQTTKVLAMRLDNKKLPTLADKVNKELAVFLKKQKNSLLQMEAQFLLNKLESFIATTRQKEATL